MVTEEQVLDSLRNIIDPDLGRDIVSLGFIKDLKIDGGEVRFTVELTTPACPVKERFKTQCEQAVGNLAGVTSVQVMMSAMARPQRPQLEINTLRDVDHIVAVSSCKGGVGKSTVAAHLARALSDKGLAVGLLDADLYGPSFPTLFNIHTPDIYMDDNRIVPIMVDGLKVMSFGFVLGDAPAVMRGPMVSAYVQQILTQTDWGRLDYLVIDMPPGTGDIQLTITQLASLDGALIVTTPQALSLVDVAKGIQMFEGVNVPVLGLVENMSYFVCDNCQKKHRIFGGAVHSLKERFGLSTLVELPIIPGISDLDHLPPGVDLNPIRQLADSVITEIGKRRVQNADLATVDVKPGHLRIHWPDKSESLLPNAAVRAACSCAQCVDEFSGQPKLDPATIPPDIEVENIKPLGNYAVWIAWTDGHGSGIYSWEHLRNIAARNI